MKLLRLNKLSAEKRKHLFVVIFVTAVVLGGLGFGLVKAQFSVLADLKKKHDEVDGRLTQMNNMVKRAATTEAELVITSKRLGELENNMAARDVYSWAVNTLRRFKQPYKNVEIPQVGQPSIGDMSLLPKFPYKQASMRVSGTAYYYDLGRFLADFENEFPQVRVINLEIHPASIANQRGMLAFEFDIVTLVNPNPS
jgi:hypothetical protein